MVRRALLSQSPPDPNQLETSKSRNDPKEVDTSLNQLASLCISCNCASNFPEVFIQQACFRKPEVLEIRAKFVMRRKTMGSPVL